MAQSRVEHVSGSGSIDTYVLFALNEVLGGEALREY